MSKNSHSFNCHTNFVRMTLTKSVGTGTSLVHPKHHALTCTNKKKSPYCLM